MTAGADYAILLRPMVTPNGSRTCAPDRRRRPPLFRRLKRPGRMARSRDRPRHGAPRQTGSSTRRSAEGERLPRLGKSPRISSQWTAPSLTRLEAWKVQISCAREPIGGGGGIGNRGGCWRCEKRVPEAGIEQFADRVRGIQTTHGYWRIWMRDKSAPPGGASGRGRRTEISFLSPGPKGSHRSPEVSSRMGIGSRKWQVDFVRTFRAPGLRGTLIEWERACSVILTSGCEKT